MSQKGYAGRRVVVMGLGLFGGGEGAVRFLCERGAEVVVTDLRKEEQLAPVLERLKGLPNLTLRLGRHEEEDFRGADMVVVNPAVPDDSPYLALAREAGAQLTTEINLFFRHCRAKITAITGTNGKSTTALLTHLLLDGLGIPSRLGGNIGTSLLPEVENFSPEEAVVLELSSFQLERLRWEAKSPHVCAVLNLTPNHLDRHPTMENYANAKAGGLDNQTEADFAVLNGQDGWFLWFRRRVKGRLSVFMDDYGDAAQTAGVSVVAGLKGDELCVGKERVVWRAIASNAIQYPGFTTRPVGHNMRNLVAAAACAFSTACRIGIDPSRLDFPSAIAKVAEKFHPLPHRLETVAKKNGVLFVNDSIATNPESVLAALATFPDRGIVLIAGGHDKGLDYTTLARHLTERAKKVVLLETEGGRKIAAALEAVGFGGILFAGDMEEAVRVAAEAAAPGDVVLLSPACASYGMFANFTERGEAFRAAVQKL